MNMAWSNVGNLKGPKGDVGDAEGSIQQGAIVFAYDSSPAAKAMLESEEWVLLGNFTVYVNSSTHDIDFYPSPAATDSRCLCVFAKA